MPAFPSPNGGYGHFEETTNRSGRRGLDNEHRYTRTFQMLVLDALDGANFVLVFGQAGQPLIPGDPFAGIPGRKVPQPGDKYQELSPTWAVMFEDNDSVCVEVVAEQNDPDNLRNWTIRAEYVGVSDPVALPAEVEIEPVAYQVALIDDLTPNTNFPPGPLPVVNSAGDPLAAGVTVDRSRFRITIVKNVLTYDPIAMEVYQDSLNLNSWVPTPGGTPAQPGTCKLTMGATRVRRTDNSTFYWRRRTVVDYDRRGWDIKVRDCGFNERVDDKIRPIILPGGIRPATPYPLDGEGGRLIPGSVPGELTFVGYERKDWAPLNVGY